MSSQSIFKRLNIPKLSCGHLLLYLANMLYVFRCFKLTIQKDPVIFALFIIPASPLWLPSLMQFYFVQLFNF